MSEPETRVGEIRRRRALVTQIVYPTGTTNHDDYEFFVNAPADIDYLLSLLPQPSASERCVECVECHHSTGVDPRGRCLETQRDPGGSMVYCGHKCVFATTGPTEHPLDMAARIAYDMIVSGCSAKEVSIAIHALKAVATTTRDGAGRQLIQDLAMFSFDVLMDDAAPRLAIMGSVSALRHMQARAQAIIADSAPADAAEGEQPTAPPREGE